MAEPFLAVKDVTVRFGGLIAVDHLALAVDESEIVGLIGPNGAGKTTSFGAIFGLVPTIEGSVRIAGREAASWPAHRRARAGLGRTFQRLELFGSMSVRENFLYATEAGVVGANPWRLLGRGRFRRHDEAEATLDLLGLGDVADIPAGDLPLGTGRLVELGRALCARPRLLLLDEPASGLDAAETERIGGYIAAAVAERGVGVLLVEHDMSLVMALCQRLYVLEFGRLIAEGSTADVARSEIVRAAYLGADHAA